MNRANPHGASFVTQNKFGLEATFIYCYSNGIDALYCFQTNCICFLNLQCCLKLSFFWAIKFGFIFLSDERAWSFFTDCHWVMLFLMAFFFFEYRLSNFIFTFLMNNCQIVKKWIHIYYKMFRSLSKGTPLKWDL